MIGMSGASELNNELHGALEALMFVSDEPVSAAALAKMLDKDLLDVDAALVSLALRFEAEERGIQLREVAGGWRLYSHPAYHEIIEEYILSWDTRSLSQAALEALAVIAYHQPTTRGVVNGIRGVNSEGVISSLIEKGLVREMGRDSGPGNAILYGTTNTFLEKFGLKSLKELSPLDDFAPDEQSKAFIRERLSAREPKEEELDQNDEVAVSEIAGLETTMSQIAESKRNDAEPHEEDLDEEGLDEEDLGGVDPHVEDLDEEDLEIID